MASSKSGSAQFRMNEGDWICDDVNCGNINFARRQNCNMCGRDKPENESEHDKNKKKLGHEIGKAAAEKSKGLFSADDWQCGRCGNVNWARRMQCNMCNAPKFGENEERTGLGGGYNERVNVEYIEREDSDGEYDDFGRKKKKFKNRDIDAPSSSNKHDNDVKDKKSYNDNDNDDDDDDDADVSKYKLDSDDDEEDDDDDDDCNDMSKYDLNADDGPKKPSYANTNSSISKRRRSSSSSSSSSESPKHKRQNN